MSQLCFRSSHYLACFFLAEFFFFTLKKKKKRKDEPCSKSAEKNRPIIIFLLPTVAN